MTFQELLKRTRGDSWIPPERLLCFDPGETTGWCLFEKAELVAADYFSTKAEGYEALQKVIDKADPTHFIVEDYRVYGNRASQHINSELFTPRLIGTLDFIAWTLEVPINYQMASTAKGFCNDQKLKQWGFWIPGKRHTRDAIRHGAYFLLFHGRSQKK